jgi:hypothetical protein
MVLLLGAYLTWRQTQISRAGPVNLAAALRQHARDPIRPLATLGITYR